VRTTWFQRGKGGGVQLPLFGNIRLTPDDVANQKLLYDAHTKLVGAMHAAGVKILAGTDTPVPYCFPGSGVHDELELFVKAGMTPAAALKTATYNAAEFHERLNELGTVEKGKLADLVLLDADPLADITNVRKIHAVVLGGRLYSTADVEKMATGRWR
jgi:imidazolonepropionase-like amidohydrolase